MSSFLVGYATRYGSTQEVAETVAATLRECGLEVDVQPLRKVGTLAKYSGIVLGAPLFMFHWHKDAHGFLSRHRRELMERPVAVFVLGPVHKLSDFVTQAAQQALAADAAPLRFAARLKRRPLGCHIHGTIVYVGMKQNQ